MKASSIELEDEGIWRPGRHSAPLGLLCVTRVTPPPRCLVNLPLGLGGRAGPAQAPGGARERAAPPPSWLDASVTAQRPQPHPATTSLPQPQRLCKSVGLWAIRSPTKSSSVQSCLLPPLSRRFHCAPRPPPGLHLPLPPLLPLCSLPLLQYLCHVGSSSARLLPLSSFPLPLLHPC